MKTARNVLIALLLAFLAIPAMAQHNYSGSWAGVFGGHGSGDGLKESLDVEDVRGNFVGFGAGYDWQKGNVVVGIIGDISGARINGVQTVSTSYKSSYDDYSSTRTEDTKATLDRFYTLRGRLGYVAGNWLVYGTGGIASARIKTGDIGVVQYRGTDGGKPYSGTDVNELKRVINATGWVFGVGAEYAINQDWRAKVEVLNLQVQDNYYARESAQFRIVQAGVEYRF